MSYQSTIVLGRIGQDPVTKNLPSGGVVCNTSIACTEHWTDQRTGERKKYTTWYNLSVFDDMAETFAQYVKKDDELFVIGTVKARAYVDNDGLPRASLDMRVQRFSFVGGNGAGGFADSTTEDVPF